MSPCDCNFVSLEDIFAKILTTVLLCVFYGFHSEFSPGGTHGGNSRAFNISPNFESKIGFKLHGEVTL